MHKLSFLLVLVNDLNVWFGLNNEFSNDSKHVKAPPVDVHGVDTLRLQFSQKRSIPTCIKGKVYVNVNLSISVGALVGVLGLSLGRVQWRAVGKDLG